MVSHWGRIVGLNGFLRKVYQKVLHLPMSTPNGMLYRRVRDGGLGLPIVATMVARSRGLGLSRLLDESELGGGEEFS